MARLAGLSLLLPGCLTNSPKAVVSDASVTESKIADNAVTTTKIRAGHVMTDNIQDGAITTAKLAAGVVITGTSGSWTGSGSFGTSLTVGTTLGVGTTLTVGTGLTVTAGGATISAGNLLLSAGNATVTGDITTTGNSIFGNSGQIDTHTINGRITQSFTADPALTAGATDAALAIAGTASPTGVSNRSYRGISNILSAAPTAGVAAVSAGNYMGADNQILLSPTVAQPNMSAYGSSNIARLDTPLALNQLMGTFGRAHNSDIDTVTNGIGVGSEVLNDTTGTIANAYGMRSAINNDSTGTIQNSYAFWGMLDQNAGTVGNYVGLYLQDPADPTGAAATALAGGGARYGVFSDGATAINFFEGRVGIGTGNTNPDSALDVMGGVCVTSNTALACTAAAGEIQADLTITANAFDLAERFPSNAKLAPGTIVAVDEKSPEFVREASSADENVVGIVSTAPGLVLGWENNEAFKNAKAVSMVAMAGRVPVLVTGEGGEIKVGDKVMLSSKSGHGMKATAGLERPVVGVALEAFKGKGEGSILVLVKNEQSSKGFVAMVTGLIAPILKKVEELAQRLTGHDQKLAALERKIEVENIALRSENKQLKDRLEKIEQALALNTPPQVEKKKGRKLASK